jgi:predicted MFS family arabinose efflux permease
LLIGLFGISVSMLLIGLSRSFIMVVLSRMLCGALNGNTGVAKSVTGELTDNTNVAQAFALVPMTWAAGNTLA